MFTSKLFLSESVSLIKTGKITVKEYVSDLLKNIELKENEIRALVAEKNRKERLFNDISILEKRFPNPAERPFLFGIPVGIKDIIRIEGFETGCGSELPPELFIGAEATVVERLKKAGALILGKTVSTEFAYFEPGPTRNPHNLLHTPGGSSSGSAAAVACGYTPLALGTQTIGSITRPAAYCGVIGFKPSFGRISTDGVVPFSTAADTVGFFTQDLDGISIAASVMCNNWKQNIPIVSKKPIIGIMSGKYSELADTEIQTFFEQKIKEFEKSGYRIIRVNGFDNIEKVIDIHKKMVSAEFAEVHETWFKNYEKLYRPGTKNLILEGKKITIGELSEARIGRQNFREHIENIQIANGIDIWMSPSSTTTAPEGTVTGSPLMNLPWTYSGLPTVNIPAGKSKNDLPFGLQFAGEFNKDEHLIEILKLLDKTIFNFL
jgi:Asp-tRNA(Asn)/Glu-tRNA(Gln) amidotransferase A subunit family amidase